jgi:aerobic carbon-monoxide dehydrogenase medium subunit
MKPAPFVYHCPKDLKEALRILADVAPLDGRVLAGGQSLAAMMAYRIATPGHLVDINCVETLSRLLVGEDEISISACVRHAAFERIATPGPTGALLSAVVRDIAHYPIRRRGTFCGSLAHADPASEWCLVAATLGAIMIARSEAHEREIPAVEFFGGVMTTALRPEEMLVETRLPLLAADVRHGFVEFSRRAGDFAIAAVLATGRLVDGSLAGVRLGVGGAEAFPRRLEQVEDALEGERPNREVFAYAANRAADLIEPLEDSSNSCEYRRDLVRALTSRALTQAFL